MPNFFNEMHSNEHAGVREHYRRLDTWLDGQPPEENVPRRT